MTDPHGQWSTEYGVFTPGHTEPNWTTDDEREALLHREHVIDHGGDALEVRARRVVRSAWQPLDEREGT